MPFLASCVRFIYMDKQCKNTLLTLLTNFEFNLLLCGTELEIRILKEKRKHDSLPSILILSILSILSNYYNDFCSYTFNKF
jgi:hypothetical protein